MTNGIPVFFHICDDHEECVRVRNRFTPILHGTVVEIPKRYLDEFIDNLYQADDELGVIHDDE